LGNLADLGLGDIFQIVSLSRRSGTLQLTTSSQSGEIVFDNGRVVAAFTTGEKETVGERLLAADVVTPTLYQEMLAAQDDDEGHELFEKFDLDPETVADALEEILKNAVYDMFEWDEGTFSFVLEDEPDAWRGFSLTGTRIVVQRGLNPQYLAIEGARIRDERTQDDTLDAFLARDKPKSPPGLLTRKTDVQTFAAQLRETDAPPAERDKVIPFPTARARREPADQQPESIAAAAGHVVPPPEPPAAPSPRPEPEVTSVPAEPDEPEEAAGAEVKGPEPEAEAGAVTSASRGRLLVIDDDPQVTRQLLTAFSGRFAAVSTANTVADALCEIESGPPGLVVASDLIIARSDGGGILGGIEILERVRARSPEVPVVLFTDYENAEAEDKANKLGVSAFLMKPRKAQIQGTSKGGVSSAMKAFLKALTASFAPFVGVSELAAPAAPAPPESPAPEPLAPVDGSAEQAESVEVESQAVEQEPPDAVEAMEVEPDAVEPMEVEPDAVEPMEVESDAEVESDGVEPVETARPEPEALARIKPVRVEVPMDPVEVTPPAVQEPPAPDASLSYDLRREMAGVLEDADVPGSDDLPPLQEMTGPVSTLRSMLAELVDPANRDTVTLLALRFASLVFERAGLFLVTRRAYIGLGGFSLEESSDQFVVRVRRIQVPVTVDSVFATVARYRSPFRGTLDGCEGNESLIAGLGGAWPESGAVAMPLVSNDRVAAILYGDNPSGLELGASDTLEIFLQQAGLAMDRVLLERKLEEARRRRTE